MISKKLPVCRANDLPPGKAVSFRYGVSNGIAYNDGGTIKAYLNRCTHMGGTVALVQMGWSERPGPSGAQGGGCEGCVFRCGWHEAEFDPATGQRLSGEAPEGTALTPIVLETMGDQIMAVLELHDEFE